MAKQYLIQCDYCHQWEYRSRPQARFCCDAHKTEYHRSGPLPENDPSQSVTDPKQAHEQAVNADAVTAAIEKLTAEIASLKALVISAAAHPIEEKKSDFVPGQPTFTLPTEKPTVREIDPEGARQKTIQNTLAALDDF